MDNPALGGPGSFAWLVAELGDYKNARLGPLSMDAQRRNLDARLLTRGYVTSHVSLSPQNLSQGVLLVQLHLGRWLALSTARLPPRRPGKAQSRPVAIGRPPAQAPY